MFLNALAGAIDAAHPKQFDYLSRQIWQAHAAGHVADDDAQGLAERLHRRRNESGVVQGALFPTSGSQIPGKHRSAPTAFSRRPEQRSPDRQESVRRRRRLAASGPMPPALACRFTVGELAVLRIVGDEIHAKGTCDCSLAEIAARAGVCRKLAQLTLRMAARDGLITVQRRPRPGRKNLSNVVRIISGEWLIWLRHRNHRPSVDPSTRQGEKNFTPRAKIQTRGLPRKEARAPCTGSPHCSTEAAVGHSLEGCGLLPCPASDKHFDQIER
jgi:hypothetical protein